MFILDKDYFDKLTQTPVHTKTTVRNITLNPIRNFRRKYHMTALVDDGRSLNDLRITAVEELILINQIIHKNYSKSLSGIFNWYYIYTDSLEPILSGYFTKDNIKDIKKLFKNIIIKKRKD